MLQSQEAYVCGKCGRKVAMKSFDLGNGRGSEECWVCDNPETPHVWGLPYRAGDFEYNRRRAGTPGLAPWPALFPLTLEAQRGRINWTRVKSLAGPAVAAVFVSASLFLVILPSLSRQTLQALAVSRILI